MKNVILGIFGGLLILYTVMIGTSLYRIRTAENAMELSLPSAMVSVMEEYYGTGENSSAEAALRSDLTEAMSLRGDEDIRILINACDMEKGVISVEVEETLTLPGGLEKDISTSRILIVDRENPKTTGNTARQ